jgi:hypothetical protein
VNDVTPLGSSNESSSTPAQWGLRNGNLNLLGRILVTKTRLIHSSVQYAILLQPGRLIFVKIGGQFPNRHQVRKLEALLEPSKGLSIEELLALDKFNFQLTNAEVSEIEIHKTSESFRSPRTGFLSTGAIKIKGNRNEYLEMWPDQDIQEGAELLNQALPSKIIFKH